MKRNQALELNGIEELECYGDKDIYMEDRYKLQQSAGWQ